MILLLNEEYTRQGVYDREDLIPCRFTCTDHLQMSEACKSKRLF